MPFSMALLRVLEMPLDHGLSQVIYNEHETIFRLTRFEIIILFHLGLLTSA